LKATGLAVVAEVTLSLFLLNLEKALLYLAEIVGLRTEVKLNFM